MSQTSQKDLHSQMESSSSKVSPKGSSARYPTHSHLLSSGASKIFNKPSLFHPQQVFTARLKAAEQRVTPPTYQQQQAASIPSQSGEDSEQRQTSTTDDYTPDLAKSLPLEPNRQALVDDVIALYSCQPTVERVKRYTPDCVYDDQFVHANDRYKIAGQWFALPKLFEKSKNNGYQIVKNERDFIQFKNDQSWTFRTISKTAHVTSLVSLSLDVDTVDSDFIQIKHHKDQTNEQDYSHEELGFSIKKWQADNVAEHLDSPETQEFKADQNTAKEHVQKYSTSKEERDVPKETFTKY